MRNDLMIDEVDDVTYFPTVLGFAETDIPFHRELLECAGNTTGVFHEREDSRPDQQRITPKVPLVVSVV